MLQYADSTNQGGRPYNEDTVRCVQRDSGLCLVVADGLGGHGGGSQASAAAADTICQGWDGTAELPALTGLVQQAHRRIQALQTEQCAMKSTVAALVLKDGTAAWTHVGDTRLYHFHNGGLVFQTLDHSVPQISVMLGEITPDQIRFHEDRNRILRALGQEGELTVDGQTEALEKGSHAFLLCTDGFWEYVLEDEMAADLAAADGPEQWLALMRERAAARAPGDCDNNTAAAVWL